MSVIKSTLTAGGGILGGGGVTVGGGYGVHALTAKTIEEFFKDDLLPTDEGKNTSEWQELEKTLKAATESDYGLDSVTVAETPTGKALPEWCKKQLSERYGSFLYSDLNYVLRIKTYCIYSISKKIESDSKLEVLSTNGGDEDFKNKFQNLITLTGTTNGDITKVPSLNQIKTQYSNKDKDWPHLREWCKWALDKGYKIEDDLYKLTKHLCSKSKSN